MSLGHSRRFGAGVTSLHQADDMHEVQVVYQERRQRQHDIKESLQAIDAYRFEQQRVQDEKQGTRPRHLSESLSTTSMKIGQSPAPYLNKKKQEWVPWEASEFQRQRERDELWQNLTDKSGLSSFHGTSSKHERLNPITHHPLSPDRGYGGGGGGGGDGCRRTVLTRRSAGSATSFGASGALSGTHMCRRWRRANSTS